MTPYRELLDDRRAAESSVESPTAAAAQRTDRRHEVHLEAGQRDRLAEEVTIAETVRDIERGLAQDDPNFARRIRRLEVRDAVNAVAVFALLAVGAVLLVVGMATQTWSTYLAGAAAFLVSLVDAQHQRAMRRPR